MAFSDGFDSKLRKKSVDRSQSKHYYAFQAAAMKRNIMHIGDLPP
jgi:hypothetical protein